MFSHHWLAIKFGPIAGLNFNLFCIPVTNPPWTTEHIFWGMDAERELEKFNGTFCEIDFFLTPSAATITNWDDINIRSSESAIRSAFTGHGVTMLASVLRARKPGK